MPSFGPVLRSLLVTVALLSAFEAIRPLEHGAAGVVIGLVALAILALAVCVVAGPGILRASWTAPRRERDPSAVVAQSDPDAAGHARPRAPSVAASAA
ncbi:DUF6412 domain-containing protein [Microbacterium ulmi]|uniref:Uncharacterized protein n=1 Tax=Microbacterium ulmi TaxID=179095 RepID=A0A7Y2Q0M7_9MICO|nr:DUF6412 domain-containing protein [Microbacterium ulmi]NII68438.1 hypothetical protein [Microbacterium ulmi]NNH03040.1 hypothetical protein [Microbacterium ulmi]